LKEFADQHRVEYLDLQSLFKDREGNLGEEYSLDGLHLNGAAYTIWAEELKKRIIAGQKR